MRTHTTKTLKDLVLNQMDSEKYQMTAQEIDIWVQTMPEITREMFEAIHLFTGHLFQKGTVSRQLQQIHKECIYLLDKLDKMVQPAADMEKLKLALISCLDHILEKLISDCAKYLEFDIWMPVLHLRREQYKITEAVDALTAMFNTLAVDKKLQKVIFCCMTEATKASRFTYERIAYVHMLQQSLMDCCRRAGKASVCADLLYLLVERNYNADTFIEYYKKSLLDNLAGFIEEQEQLTHLGHLERDLRSIGYRKSAFCYDNKRTRARDVLLKFVESEQMIRSARSEAQRRIREETLRATQAKSRGFQVNSSNSVKKSADLGYKIRTAMSVDALAYFIKLMVHAKLIEPGVKTELMTCVGAVFQTPSSGIDGISPGSLNNKYKLVTQSTAVAVRASLSKMLKLIQDEFG